MMRLINTHTNQPLVEFKEEDVIFHSKFLEDEMRMMGIPIPHGLRGIYNGKDCIHLGEEGFSRAFKEIYYLMTMNPATFKWVD